MAISKIDSDGITAGGITADSLNIGQIGGSRNKIINGDMRIDQRNAGAAVTANNAFPVDRFFVSNSTDGAFSAQQDSSAPAGFINSVKFTTTTADGTLAATQNSAVFQRIEGTNIADLGWGTASAKAVTLSFWVRSSLTGTFGGALRNSAQDRSYPFTYTISVVDTWEYKTVTVAGDTSGTWLTTTGSGIQLTFGLGAGSDRSGTAGAWNSNNNTSATGAVSVIGTLNATWYITGVQLEVGSVATPFEHRSYGEELALCQRYYQRKSSLSGNYVGFGNLGAITASTAFGSIEYIGTMRSLPSFGVSNCAIYENNLVRQISSLGTAYYGDSSLAININITSSVMGVGNVASLIGNNNANAYVEFEAEL